MGAARTGVQWGCDLVPSTLADYRAALADACPCGSRAHNIALNRAIEEAEGDHDTLWSAWPHNVCAIDAEATERACQIWQARMEESQ